MTADHWQRCQELFEEARKLPPEQWVEFLTRTCGSDAELRREVESLLAHHRQAPVEFLAPAEADGTRTALRDPPGPDPLVGQRIGRYHVKSVIAVGGMGTVYEAVQEEPHRVVALKVMHRNVASASALRRFQFEAQVLGRLRHPHVAQVYEAGTHPDPNPGREAGAGPRTGVRGSDVPVAPGIPFFAMEYVPGARPITEYAAEHELGIRERLVLFANVCDAVHHGHQKGIIHRDLKPANILVDSAGEPKVIDFGVARATDSDLAITTQQTAIGQLIGTMQYMSPEQCDADPHDLDTRTDVYSLGVVLYELLTGELPYDASTGTIYAATRVIKEQTPRRPSTVVGERRPPAAEPATGVAGSESPPVRRGGRGLAGWGGRLARQLRGDADTIVLKALEKDRARRYQSAADLARDIRHFLASEPIEARAPTAWERVTRWAMRHPVMTTAAACVLVGLLTTGAIATVGSWFLHRRPYDVVASPNKREAWLVSLGGNTLHRWPVPEGDYIALAALRDRPREFGGGRLALVGFDGGVLYAFDVNGDPNTPLWTGAFKDDEVRLDLRAQGMKGERWDLHWAVLYDVFPEPDEPGPEIVTQFSSGNSTRTIRIYNLRGDVCYEAWHDGTLSEPFWMPEAGLLIFTGSDQIINYNKGQRLNADPDPFVLFALRPAAGVRSQDYMLDPNAADAVKPVWCLRAEPAGFFKHVIRYRPEAASKPDDPLHAFRLLVHFDDEARSPVRGCSWVFDDSGKLLHGPDLSDEYKANQLLKADDPNRLPDPNEVHFVPYPTTAPPATRPVAQP